MTRSARWLVVLAVPIVFGASMPAQQRKPAAKTPAKAAAPAPIPAAANGVALQRSVSAVELQKTLTAINFDRTAGKDGEKKAAAYVEDRLKEYGVKYTRYDARVLLSWPGKAEIALFGEVTGSMKAVAPSFSAPTPKDGLTAEAIYLAAPLSQQPLAQDGRGRILVIAGPLTPDSVSRAEQTGAVGVIHVNDTDVLHEGSASPIWGTPTATSRARLPKLPVVSVSRGSGDRLRSAVGRGPVAVRITAEVQQQWTTVPVIVAEIPGAAPEFVLVGAHLDSWYEGMTESATGVAALVEMARVLQPQRTRMKRGVRLAWWSGRTVGNFAGSAWYADRFWNELERQCVAYTNVENIGRRGWQLAGINGGAWPALLDFTKRTAQALVPKASLSAPERFQPDRDGDASFQGIGVPEFWLGALGPAKPTGDMEPSGRTKFWRTKDDKTDRVDPKVLTLETQYRVAAVYDLALAPVVPLQLTPIANGIVRALDDLNAAAAGKFDLSSVRAAATALAGATARLDQAAKPTRPEAITALNRLLIRLSHRLDATLYTRGNRVDQDPVGELPMLPLLADVARLAKLAVDGDDFAFLETELVRARNAVEATLREAADEILAYLGAART